ncbi:MAG: VWA domain-containing protein [Zhengella sp.]|uniref:VWA domain-containing protein n=1 Tax=Zhengella sp. TaxID=2282762 RepID=UPI001D7B88FE|nr:VWA domain-containing protein [Notoacmeibacter sp.]MCC0026671.1 VWA domain-containing protein [Brucellaceae bacterium]
MVSFGFPLALLALPLPVMLVFWGHGREAAEAPALPPALSEALAAASTGAGTRVSPRLLLFALAWLCLVAGAAQPRLALGETVTPASGRALALAVDLSGSMERRDFVLDGAASDRLSAVKAVASAFIEKRQGDRIGLVLFGDEAFSASPVSFDRSAVIHALNESAIGMAGRTTAIGEALGLAIVKLRDDPAAQRAVVLLSDGTNNSGSVEPEDAARLARDNGIRIHAIGLGSVRQADDGSPLDPSADLDEATLKAVSDISGGQFFRARTLEELAAAYESIDRMEAAQAAAPPFVPERDLTALAAIGFILFMALAMAPLGRRLSA